MRVFVTGATGFVGSAVVKELRAAGHQVLGLARSDAAAAALKAAGAQVHLGSIEDLQSLRDGASDVDGVIHTAFNHDFSKYVENCAADRHVIAALGSVLIGTDRPLVITTGMTFLAEGRLGTEHDAPPPSVLGPPRSATEEATTALVSQQIRAMVVRLPQVHDPLKQGFISFLIALAREKGIAAYVGEGLQRWPAVHVSDAAVLYRLALEKGVAGHRYHAVHDQGVALRDIAACIGQGLKLPVVSVTPEKAAEHFGWLAPFVAMDIPASSALTRAELGWNPSRPSLLSDLGQFAFA
ncbi:MAG: SDR family oxidoreductase [Limnobacter sp.]|uniref:SDR family oxidoreductase n=1 Tax=Limnobacter sp. TaxID=2003368 RepID=UPI0012162107|nr:SDR family oxidoreductase [Limnobacter sp.]RZO94502.1 MAG: SDR family oxidoreductase [Limnobacter sp.]